MSYMFDTDMCIYLIKNLPESVLTKVKENHAKGISISAITLAELEFGISNSGNPEKNRNALTQMLSIIDVLPFDSAAANEYGTVRAKLQKKGEPIGNLDMLIGSHALSRNLTIVTNNVREFSRIEELKIENWAEN